jgi:hypothetical protein
MGFPAQGGQWKRAMRPRGVTAHARWKIGPEIVALTLTAELAVRARRPTFFLRSTVTGPAVDRDSGFSL